MKLFVGWFKNDSTDRPKCLEKFYLLWQSTHKGCDCKSGNFAIL